MANVAPQTGEQQPGAELQPVGHPPPVSATVMIANISWNAGTVAGRVPASGIFTAAVCVLGSAATALADETFETPVLKVAGDVTTSSPNPQ